MIFSFYIFHSIKDFYSYEKNLFKDFMKFSKNYLRKKMFIHVAGLSSYQDIFLGIFFEFSELFICGATVND